MRKTASPHNFNTVIDANIIGLFEEDAESRKQASPSHSSCNLAHVLVKCDPSDPIA